jgi:hypothetical protein
MGLTLRQAIKMKCLSTIIEEVYTPCGLMVSSFVQDREGKEYEACTFQLNALYIVARMAKITPKKMGQFVSLWKRKENGETTPYEEWDKVDLFVINVQEESHIGQFIFPKAVLMEKGIVSHCTKEGKRGFRVYPPWSGPTNKTALSTQKWQLEYFLKLGHQSKTDLHKAKTLYLHK